MSMIKDLFKDSPFEPLRYHMKSVMECVGFVRPMFEAVRDGQFDSLQDLTKKVFKAEHRADIIKDDIRGTIPKRFFLPVYRGDLLGYVKLQDDMADSVEDLAILLTIKRLSMPDELASEIFAYADTVLHVCDKAYEMNERLRDLVAHGFHADQAVGILEMIRGVEKSEWEADKAQYHLSQSLFAMEDKIKPSDLMLWWRVFLELGELANHAEKTADRLRRMLSQ